MEIYSLVLNASAALCLIVAGVFLAFSDFVMDGLRHAAPDVGASAMQWINRRVYGSVFLVTFLGLGPVCLGLAVISWSSQDFIVVAGALVYCAGVIGVTLLGNVPMNQRLDALSVPQRYWPDYDKDWSRLNHIRTSAAAISGVLFMAAG